jgi:hypothetical protein
MKRVASERIMTAEKLYTFLSHLRGAEMNKKRDEKNI